MDKEKRRLQEVSAQVPSVEEQLARRQSAPRPDAVTAVQDRAVMPEETPEVYRQAIGEAQISEATAIMQRYKTGKKNLESRIVANEQWYKMRHWEQLRTKDASGVEPTSGWLFNAIANKHASAMDNFPSPNILPREPGDKEEAQKLSSIVPVILDQCEFEQAYSDFWDYKLKSGTGVYGVFWDKDKLNGLGDVSIQQCDLLNLFWEPGIKDIQASPNFFSVELVDNKLLEEEYPQLHGRLSTPTIQLSQYCYDDAVDTTQKSAVIDWYYKRRVGRKTVLHYCKYCNNTVLYASENDPEYAERGYYDHGLYPYVFDPLFRTEGTPTGFGYIDVAKSSQEYVDRGNQAIMQNMLANAKPRYFSSNSGNINEEEFADLSKDIVHVEGTVETVKPIEGKVLSSVYVECVRDKIDELKETTGNRDISTGGTTSGVTAASAIAAMQEAGSKLDRDGNKSAYRAYRKVVLMVIELIRQFYDLPRQFRILGENGAEQFVEFSNAGIMPQHQGMAFGQDMGWRKPLFDVEITAQKQSPYSKMAQNELALQFYSAGFFNPQMADQALACLDMMDFDRKQSVMQKIAQNGGMYQQMLAMQQQMIMLAQMVDQLKGTDLAEQVAAGVMGQPVPVGGALPEANKTEALGGESGAEASNTKNARKRVAESTSPT